MTEIYGNISSLVAPAGCIAAAEAGLVSETAQKDMFTYQYSILVQCGARGFRSDRLIFPWPDSAENPMANDHIASAARLCMAMCVDCPNRTIG